MASSSDITFSSLKKTINEIGDASDDDTTSVHTEDEESHNESENNSDDVDMDTEAYVNSDESETDVSCDEYSEYSDTEDDEVSGGSEDEDDEMDDADSQDEETDKAIDEIRHYQSTVHNLIPFENFSRLVREIGQDYKTDLNFTKDAILALQCASEDYLVTLFRQSQICANHGGRIAIKPKDFQLARYLKQYD